MSLLGGIAGIVFPLREFELADLGAGLGGVVGVDVSDVGGEVFCGCIGAGRFDDVGLVGLINVFIKSFISAGFEAWR